MFTEKKTPTGELPDLNTTDGFVSAANAMRTKKAKYPEGMEPPGNLEIQSSEGRVWCPGCEGRKVVVEMSSLGGPNVTYCKTDEVFLKTWGKNQRYQLDCRQCDTSFAAMLFDGPEKLEHIIIPNRRGGYATPRTPEQVAYYLDQASRAEMTGANSAAVAMFRAALEQLFHQEGYTAGMLKA
ncbi:MAG: hypothetical protein OER77_09125 [Myxococcales bacterium]|nr:hypothetical protein [Myxococcales bacterium]